MDNNLVTKARNLIHSGQIKEALSIFDKYIEENKEKLSKDELASIYQNCGVACNIGILKSSDILFTKSLREGDKEVAEKLLIKQWRLQIKNIGFSIQVT